MAACTTHIRQEVKGAEASLCLFDFLTLVKWKGKCEPMAGTRQRVDKAGKRFSRQKAPNATREMTVNKFQRQKLKRTQQSEWRAQLS